MVAAEPVLRLAEQRHPVPGQRLDNNDSNSGYTYMYFGNEHYGEVTSHAISAGRDISAADCRTRARVCVIGETLRKYFFGAMSPIGQKLQIGGKDLRSSACMPASMTVS